MQIDRRVVAHFDWSLFVLPVALALLGIITIYSATRDVTGDTTSPLALKQLYWFLIGLGALLAVITFDYHLIDRLAYFFYAAVLLLLIAVPVWGFISGGSQRWIHLGYFTLQPSELAKLAIVAVLARWLQYDEPSGGYRLRDLWVPLLVVAPAVIMILLQPDLGTAFVCLLVMMSVLLMGGLRLRAFFLLAAFGVTLLPVVWQFLKPYQRLRIWTFVNPNLDPLGAGYHAIQSKIAIGSGRWLGKGYLQGTQNRLDFLPAQHTDFAFSVFAEEWGFLGCLLLLGFYLALMLTSLRVVRRAKDRFGALLAFGMATILFWQIIINVGMVLGILPVVGIPLPLFSYGGSSLVTLMAALGVMISVSMRRFTF